MGDLNHASPTPSDGNGHEPLALRQAQLEETTGAGEEEGTEGQSSHDGNGEDLPPGPGPGQDPQQPEIHNEKYDKCEGAALLSRALPPGESDERRHPGGNS